MAFNLLRVLFQDEGKQQSKEDNAMKETFGSVEDADPFSMRGVTLNIKTPPVAPLPKTYLPLGNIPIPLQKLSKGNKSNHCSTPENPLTRNFRRRYFPEVSYDAWCDWKWQLNHRFTRHEDLERFLKLSADERRALIDSTTALPLAVTPYYASLLDTENPLQPLRRSVIPTIAERMHAPEESEDPLNEDSDSPVSGIVHRYPDRVLFLVTDRCSTYCRYCTRSRMVGKHHKRGTMLNQWEKGIHYIQSNPAIRDVLLSGGDPLTLSDAKLSFLLSRLRRIPHVEIIRIGTKIPVVLPYRITNSLVRLLRQYHPLWMSIHFTHPNELTAEVIEACTRLADAGIPLGSQTVLLKGINDERDTMLRLVHELMKARVRPYYLYQCDPIIGSAHFRTPVAKGLEIIRGLRGHTSGYGVPNFVIDAPGGGGKIPLLPEYVLGWEAEGLVLKNYNDRTYCYPERKNAAAE
jgi:lysine 2,3-aminomutase